MSESFDTRIARSVDARLANEDARECDGGCGSVGPNGERCQGCDHGQYTRAPTEEPALSSPSGPDAETLAAQVTKALNARPLDYQELRLKADAALSGLVALVEQLTEERDDEHAHWLGMRECYDREVLRAGRAEALVEKREREIAKLHEDAAHTARTLNDAMTETFAAEDGARQAWRERAEKAEALLARHRQALAAMSVPLDVAAGHAKLAVTYENRQERDNVIAIALAAIEETRTAALAASAPGTEEPA